MDELTAKNLEILEALGYFYEEESNSFWSSNHETYLTIPLMHCNDLIRALNAVIDFEKEMSFQDGEFSAQRAVRTALGIS